MTVRDLAIGRSVVPKELLTVKASRSGGPGGQNVNKVASKIDLRLDLEGAIPYLGESAVARIREKLEARLDRHGQLQVVSSEHRDQSQNLDAALTRMEVLIEGALVKPKARRPTRPSRGSKERRLEAKRQRGAIKRERKGESEG
jgi:ribosome-associated protein